MFFVCLPEDKWRKSKYLATQSPSSVSPAGAVGAVGAVAAAAAAGAAGATVEEMAWQSRQSLDTTLWLCQNSHWKWPFIVSFPIKNVYVTVYQRVSTLQSPESLSRIIEIPLESISIKSLLSRGWPMCLLRLLRLRHRWSWWFKVCGWSRRNGKLLRRGAASCVCVCV